MKAAFLLHLYYPEIAVELVERVAALGRADIDLVATYSGALDPRVDAALDRVPGVVERVAVANAGWDVGPLFAVLPWLEARGYELVAKLHTKRGTSGYAAEWRDLAYAGTIADEPTVAAILRAFAGDERLLLAGPAPLFKSSAANQFANAALLGELAPAVCAPRIPPADWGFFAGTMFWARTALLRRVADACAAVPSGAGESDGEMAHAAERLFGLAPLGLDGRVGLVADGAVAAIDLPGTPDREPITATLVAQAERAAAPPDAGLAELIRHTNPLVHHIRHGRDADALDPNPYFSSSWYLRVNPDVAGAGVHPLAHYLEHGWRELRSTGPLFDGAFYLQAYDDVVGNPLSHFMDVGLREGRRGLPVADPAERAGLKHFYPVFDLAAERAFLDDLLPHQPAAGLVSVIMPAFNRADTIAAAIRSVIAQTHGAWELLVVDDGSTDATAAVVQSFADPRIRLLAGDHAGVSAARNRGLADARGEWIAYLDSDNRWQPWFLDTMLRALGRADTAVGYCAVALRDDLGHLTGYRGAPFDWAECLARNWIDLNCFMHRRALGEAVGGFDPALRRMVDWDLILRVTRDRPVTYAPFVGCDYFDGRADTARITVKEPAAFEKLVRLKQESGLPVRSPAFARRLRLSFAIKIAAPRAETAVWGDYHFAEALAAALRTLGHAARVDAREEWTGHELADEDVAIVLRGLLPYPPRPGQIGFLWLISHPDQPEWDELDRFHRLFAASPSHAALLAQVARPPVEYLPQATDAARFRPEPRDPHAPRLLFVGNSRGVDRPVIDWALAAGERPVIHGGGWAGRVPAWAIAGPELDNRLLPPLYAGAGAVLNDHWPAMRAFGIVSNRLFDVAAAGGRAVSDAVAGIDQLFGDAVAQVDGPASLHRALTRIDGMSETDAQRIARGEAIGAAHGFDRRAEQLVAAAFAELGLAPPTAPQPAPRPGPPPLRVHVVARAGGGGGWQSSTYIRLIAPLTDPLVADRIRLTVGRAGDPVPPCDLCIVARAAFDHPAEVDRLVATLGASGAVLVLDLDDDLRAIGGDHPEAALYRPLVAALERAAAAAAECWCSTPAVARSLADIAGPRLVLPNALDPRLWRDWRRTPAPAFAGGSVRLLYMGTHTHGPDLALLRDPLDRLHERRPGAFTLALVGVAPDVAPAPWLQRLEVPAGAGSYPRFVRWLRDQPRWDAGLAPLAPGRFNEAKSDIKLLDYAALGLLPVVQDCAAYRLDPAAAAVAFHTDDWFATLDRLLDDPTDARVRADAAADFVWTKRSSPAIAARLLARIEALTRGAA